jgi:arsenical pump membrane protein
MPAKHLAEYARRLARTGCPRVPGCTPVTGKNAESRLASLSALDWIAIGLLACGVIFVCTSLLPYPAADGTVRRILPLLLFLGTVIVLAELTASAGVFDLIAVRIARAARGNYFALFLLCALFSVITTTALNLDTTAVLLTPVMLSLARRAGITATPLAMTTIWIANTASLLLPVSNLTNLLAANRVALPPLQFAGRMWAVQLSSVAATMLFLWVFYWRRGSRRTDRYEPPPPHGSDDRLLLWIAGLACLLFIAVIFATRIPLGYASATAMTIVVAAFMVRSRRALRFRLIPWRLLVLVTGLFLVVQTISMHGLATVTRALIGTSGDASDALRTAVTGAGLSNAINNLPAYVAGEAVTPAANHAQLLALLIGTNIGPIITPWASVATMLWFERCRAEGTLVPLQRFMLTGTCLALCGISAAVGALLLTG